MMQTLLKWFLQPLIFLVIVAVIVLARIPHWNQDHSRAHSATVAALPAFKARTRDGDVRVAANGFEFRVRLAGCEPGRPAVILLHGFPASSAMWLRLMPALDEAGYCAIAPDLRGYSPGARPEGVDSYRVDYLSNDVFALADALGVEYFHLVGQDVGSMVAWATVLRAPRRVISLTSLTITHPLALERARNIDKVQKERISAIEFWSLPILPEAFFSRNNFQELRSFYEGIPTELADEYLAILSEPGALKAALNHYRAMQDGYEQVEGLKKRVSTPTLYFWGNKPDSPVAPRAVSMQGEYMTGPYKAIKLMKEGFWLMTIEHPKVIPAIIEHLNKN